MDFRTRLLSDTNTIVIIFITIRTVLLKLSALFPSYKGSKIIGRVAVGIIISYKLLFVKKIIEPNLAKNRLLDRKNPSKS